MMSKHDDVCVESAGECAQGIKACGPAWDVRSKVQENFDDAKKKIQEATDDVKKKIQATTASWSWP